MDGSLGRTFGYSHRFCDLLIADLDSRFSTGMFGGKPEIDEKTGWAMVVTDQVAHKRVDYIVIEDRHIYTDGYYSIEWHIAERFVRGYAPKSKE